MITVLAGGCFDCLHYGHLAHLRKARSLGDKLCVALTLSESVNKGPGRPIFTWNERCEMLSELKCVDAVYAVSSAEQAIRLIQPDIYVKGIEYQGRLPEHKLVEELGGRVVFLETNPVYSSTDLLSGKTLNDRIATTGSGR